ncbi:hypothetical protein E4U42_004159 [Claviceps africana]|uniref:Secreted protein n=1 Tax=Claviceps africana TaxID=83212 RepID=A0A8K0J5Q9_9HYPO|nr:hypothetical protein E4U42_004159 [Claviceps africana]
MPFRSILTVLLLSAAAPLRTTPAVTPAPRPTCDYAFCDENGSSWCFYWRGVTTWDASRGVLPGETRVPLGTCG